MITTEIQPPNPPNPASAAHGAPVEDDAHGIAIVQGVGAAPLSPQTLAASRPAHRRRLRCGVHRMQVGIAVIGIVFYSALGSSTTPAAYAHAFITAGLEQLIGVAVAVAVLLQFDKE